MTILIIAGAAFAGLYGLIRWAANEPSHTYGQRDLFRDWIKKLPVKP